MPTTRRTNNGVAIDHTSTSPSSSSRSATSPPPAHSPYLPTRTEIAFLSIYPLTLLFGSLFSHVSPTLYHPYNNSTYSVVAQSFQPAEDAPSYFAKKRNFFNVYFVKYGWFWCTLALLLFTALGSRGRPIKKPSSKSEISTQDATMKRIDLDSRLRRIYQTVFRYALATTFWIFVTQWFLGPALIDRGFKLTGGACDLASRKMDDTSVTGEEEVASVLTHAACSVAGGTWKGGYDISGHVFILVLGSGMLWLEMLPYVARKLQGFGAGRVVRDWDGRIRQLGEDMTDYATTHTPPDAIRAAVDKAQEVAQEKKQQLPSVTKEVMATFRAYATTMALATAVLSWWMLLMTAAFFHTWFEKLTGGILALGALWVVYVAPRGVPAMREVFGMPGV